MKTFINIVLWIWQIPQNILGALLILILKPEISIDFIDVRLHYATRMRGGISLGRHIILADKYKDYNGRAELHEWGHTRQSRILGPFYLFVIGIPSILWAAWWNRDRGCDYYSYWTERWANKLGRIK